jgi:hypothetical protein
MNDCWALCPGELGPCSRGTDGCDACERCICHGCYSHADETCTCPEEKR